MNQTEMTMNNQEPKLVEHQRRNEIDDNQYRGWVSCILNIKKGKNNYIAVGSLDRTVKILDNEYHVERTIGGDEYAVTSLSTLTLGYTIKNEEINNFLLQIYDLWIKLIGLIIVECFSFCENINGIRFVDKTKLS